MDKVLDLGTIDYLTAYEVQKNCVRDVINGDEQALIFCEHPLVLTMGRLASTEHLLLSEDELVKQGVNVHYIDRGGEVTLHTQGQMVVYPILDLNKHKKDLHWYMHQLEEVVIDLLTQFAIVARREKDQTGVWVRAKKLASIGIGVKKWVTYHGVGININTDLNDFQLIRPCGLDVTMTSMATEKNQTIDILRAKTMFIRSFNKVFQTQFKKGQ